MIDVYSVQPIDAATLVASAKATKGIVITVEDHYAAGGLGDAVAEAVAPAGIIVHRLAVHKIPRSGQPNELLDRYGISARHIVDAVREGAEHRACDPPQVGRGRAASGAASRTRRARRARGGARRPDDDAAGRARSGLVARRQAPRVLVFRSHLDCRRPTGKSAQPLRADSAAVERDPQWSPDGKSIVFAVDAAGDGFKLFVAPAGGGDARALTTDARRRPVAVVDHRRPDRLLAPPVGRWRLYVVPAAGGEAGRSSPIRRRQRAPGARVAGRDARRLRLGSRERGWRRRLWVADLGWARAIAWRGPAWRRVRGLEGFPAWSPDGSRRRLLRRSRWRRVGVGRAAEEAPPPDTARARVPPKRRCSCRARAARRHGRPMAGRSRSRTCRRPIRPTTAIPSATATSRRRSLRAPTHSVCGSWTRRCRSTPGRARSCRRRRERPARRRVRPRVGNAASAVLLRRARLRRAAGS